MAVGVHRLVTLEKLDLVAYVVDEVLDSYREITTQFCEAALADARAALPALEVLPQAQLIVHLSARETQPAVLAVHRTTRLLHGSVTLII